MPETASNQDTKESNNTTTTNTSYAKIQEVLKDVTNNKAATAKPELADKPSELSLIAQLYQKVDDLNKELTAVKTELNTAKGVIAETAASNQEVVQVINLLLMKAKKEMEAAATPTETETEDAPPPGLYS